MKHINSGFTLMEVLVTMAILGIITAIAIPAYTGHQKNSYLAECSNEVTAIRLAQEEFFLENNAYFPNPAGTSTGVAAIMTDSNGVFVSTYNVAGNPVATAQRIADANCSYAVVSVGGATPGYTITATGQNKLTATEVITFVR